MSTCANCRSCPPTAARKRNLHRPGQGRRQTHVRQADRPLSLRHEARRRSAGASGHSRHEHLQHALREGIRQPLPEFLSGERLRDGRRREPAQREAHQLESIELRALQDLRHCRSVPDHYVGATGRRRRAELRRDVSCDARCRGAGALRRRPAKRSLPSRGASVLELPARKLLRRGFTRISADRNWSSPFSQRSARNGAPEVRFHLSLPRY